MTGPTGRPPTADELAGELGLPAEKSELIAALMRLGVSPEQMRLAAEHGRLEDAIFEQILDPERGRRTVTAREIERRGGLPVADTQAMMRALGLPAPGPDDPLFTGEEGSAFVELGRLGELWTEETRMQVSRVYHHALSRIAETEVDLFRSRVQRRLRESSASSLDALAAVREAFGELLPLADPILLGVHRRKVEQELTQAAIWEVELEAEGAVPGSRDVTLLFCDLKDFTSYADARGDAAALEVIERLADAVEEHLGERGRLVKALGDGYMLAYREPGEAIAAAARIAAAMRDVEDVGLHAGVHRGVAVLRDGDYFGRAVNLAARLLAAADRGELIATANVAASTGERDWEARGPRCLRGFAEPLEIYSLKLGSV